MSLVSRDLWSLIWNDCQIYEIKLNKPGSPPGKFNTLLKKPVSQALSSLQQLQILIIGRELHQVLSGIMAKCRQ